jgi:hypothetical protein
MVMVLHASEFGRVLMQIHSAICDEHEQNAEVFAIFCGVKMK